MYTVVNEKTGEKFKIESLANAIDCLNTIAANAIVEFTKENNVRSDEQYSFTMFDENEDIRTITITR